MNLEIGAAALVPYDPALLHPALIAYTLWTDVYERGTLLGDPPVVSFPYDWITLRGWLGDLEDDPFTAGLRFRGDLSGPGSPFLASGTRPASPAFTEATLTVSTTTGHSGFEAEVHTLRVVPEPSRAALAGLVLSTGAVCLGKRRSRPR